MFCVLYDLISSSLNKTFKVDVKVAECIWDSEHVMQIEETGARCRRCQFETRVGNVFTFALILISARNQSGRWYGDPSTDRGF